MDRKRRLISCLCCLAFLFHNGLNAQSPVRHKVAVFVPLYLDSAFDARGIFRYEKTGAKFAAQGLDFYNGMQMAFDSLEERDAPLEIFVYDTRSKEAVSQQIARPEFESIEMIIAQSNLAETRLLAEAAQKKKIPFLSVTLPNDAGVANNPFFVILNTTLQSHIEGIHRFLQKYHSQEKILVFRKQGVQEDQIRNHFTEFNRATTAAVLNLKYVDLGADFTPQQILKELDSTRRTICVAGSLDEGFAMKLTQTLASLNKTYPVRVIGMPTWENFNFSKANDLEIIYTNPFYFNRLTPLETELANEFNAKMNAKASDLFYRGFESVLRFSLLLLDTGKDVASNLTRKGNTVLTPFDIQPVFKDKNSMTLDYFENKHLYFIKVLGGTRNILY